MDIGDDRVLHVIPAQPGFYVHADNRTKPGAWTEPIIGWMITVSSNMRAETSCMPLLQNAEGTVETFDEFTLDTDIDAHVHGPSLESSCRWLYSEHGDMRKVR